MNWSDIEVFLAVYREGTLGRAARKLGMTQPTMGRRLKKLEQDIGHSLFQRTPDGFIPTSEGETILASAERMEEEANTLQRGLAGGEQQLHGTLRLSSSDWFGVYVLAPLIARFSAQYPNIVTELITESRLLDLSRREADLVFRITPFNGAGIVSRKLLDIDYGVYCARDQPWPKAGDGSGCALITMDEAFSTMPDTRWLIETLPNSHVALRSNNREVQAQLCAQGAGIAVLPKVLARSFAPLVEITMLPSPPGRTTWVGYHQDMRRSKRLRAFLDTALINGNML
jgi:DNA-binding transcriptional LysR family regulator